MRKTHANQWGALSIIIGMMLFLFGCGPSSDQTTTTAAQPASTSGVSASIATSDPISAQATARAALPTQVFAPLTPTQTPSSVAGPGQFKATAVGAAFKAAGLEFEQVSPVARADYGLAPYLCTTALHFIVPSVCVDCGGRVFECPNQADRDSLAKFYVDMGRSSAALYSWVFVRANIVVQINGDLPEARAKQYEAALNGLK